MSNEFLTRDEFDALLRDTISKVDAKIEAMTPEERQAEGERLDRLYQEQLKRLEIGLILYGYCGGVFGRDSYEAKRVEAFGVDWVVCRGISGQIHTASGLKVHDLVQYSTDAERVRWQDR